MAQNDAALGRIVETISHSPIWKESLILVVEDDAQNGPDHVDATRTVALAIGPYVKRDAVVSDRYDQLSMLRTIEILLKLFAEFLTGLFVTGECLVPKRSPGIVNPANVGGAMLLEQPQ